MGFQLLLLGKAGVGKSAFGNFLLNGRYFEASSQTTSVTLEPVSISFRLDDVPMTIVDTPGLLSNDRPMLTTAINLLNSFANGNSEPYVFLIVLKVGRSTVDDTDTINLLKIIFGPECLQHGILIFTHEDQASNEGENIETFMRNFDKIPEQKALLAECGKRYLTVNCYERNEEVKRTKLSQLLQMIVAVNSDNNFYMPDFEMNRRVLERHVNEWTESRLSGDQMRTLLRELIDEQRKQNWMSKTKYTAIGLGLGGVLVGVGAIAFGTTVSVTVPAVATSTIELMMMLAKLKAMMARASAIPVIVSPLLVPFAVLHKS